MELNIVFTDSQYNDIGMLDNQSNIDFTCGLYTEENDFEIEIPYKYWNESLNKGSLIYSNSEVGGLVTGITSDTKNKKVRIHGVNWRGMLSKKVIYPPNGQAYFTTNCDIGVFLRNIVQGFDGLIVATDRTYGVNVTRNLRYQNILEGIEKTLSDVNYKLDITYDVDNRYAIVGASPISSNDEYEYSNDYGFNIIATNNDDGYNHCLCLGQGELENRQVAHVYRLSNGTYTQNKQVAIANGITGINERIIKYDNANAENLDELVNGGIDTLIKNCDTRQITISDVDNLDIGDKVSAKERITDISIIRTITQKIYKGYLNNLKVTYKVGE